LEAARSRRARGGSSRFLRSSLPPLGSPAQGRTRFGSRILRRCSEAHPVGQGSFSEFEPCCFARLMARSASWPRIVPTSDYPAAQTDCIRPLSRQAPTSISSLRSRTLDCRVGARAAHNNAENLVVGVWLFCQCPKEHRD